MHLSTLWKIWYVPFLGLIPLIAGFILLAQSYNLCSGNVCGGINLHLGWFLLVMSGLYILISGIVLGIVCRAKINWSSWTLIWMALVIVSLAGVALTLEHAKKSHTLYQPNSVVE
jgi:hypothetical protein